MHTVALTAEELGMLAEDVLTAGGTFRFRARGRSMRPLLADNDAVTVTAVSPKDLKVGMVVLYRGAGERLIAHRIVDICRDRLSDRITVVIRSDAFAGPSEVVEADRIIGRIVAVHRSEVTFPLDRGLRFWAGVLSARSRLAGLLLIAPGRVPRHVAARLLPRFQRFPAYRRVASVLLRDRVKYRVAVNDDIHALTHYLGNDDSSSRNEAEAHVVEHLEGLRPVGCWLIADVNGTIAGDVVLREFPWNREKFPGYWLFGLKVRVRFRGAGIAEGLVRCAFQEAVRRGAEKVSILVEHSNGPALKLYRKLGFEPASMPALEQKLYEEYSAGDRRQVILSRALP